jgi:serine/threonine protein kinase
LGSSVSSAGNRRKRWISWGKCANTAPNNRVIWKIQVEYAHSHSIIHRNITPQNVLIGKAPDQVKLGDLMLAKAQEGSLAQQITEPGEIIGDLRYMSPERTGDSRNVDARADLYSLGALMYAMLTRWPPCEGNNLLETVTKIRQAQPVTPKKFQLAIADAVESATLKLLAKRPEDRYPSAAALLKEIERIGKVNKADL